MAWPSAPATSPRPQDDPSPGRVAARSLLLPGWGQLHQGQRRGWAYLGAEVLAWTLHLHLRAEGRDLRDAYRDLAWTVARAGGGGSRVDPGFEYFETLSQWRRSGAWDAAADAPGVQPEPDETTYNGAIWRRARDLFLGGTPAQPGAPGYGDALAYYEARAWGPAFLWDWTGKEPELNRYRHLIDDSDERLRWATHALGAVLANHVLSGVDAFVSARTGARVHSRLGAAPGVRGPAWTWRVEVGR